MKPGNQVRCKRIGRAGRVRRYSGIYCLVLATLMAAEVKAETVVDLQLVLAIDVSRSIDPDEAKLQRQGYIKAFRDPDVIAAIETGMLGRIAVGYFEWAGHGHAEIIVNWTLIDSATSAHAFADTLRQDYIMSASRTSISGAIEFAQPWFDKNGFDSNRRVVDVSGDGPNNWGELVTTARDRAVAAGITINGLPILDPGGGLYSRFNIENLDLYYRDCVIGGAGAFLEVATDFNDFARAVRRKLVLEIANMAPPHAHGIMTVQAGAPCNVGESMWRDRDGF